MIVFFKNSRTYKTIGYAEASEYKVPIYSTENTSGTMTFPLNSVPDDIEGCYALAKGHAWVISSVSPNRVNGTVTLFISDFFNAFSRSHGYMPGYYSKVGTMLADMFTVNYKGNSDAEFAMPFIGTVTNTATKDLAGELIPELEYEQFYSAQEYLRQVSRLGVGVDFAFTRTAINVSIFDLPPSPVKKLVDGDGHTQVESVSKSENVASKVSVYYNSTPTVYYLAADGTISTSVPAQRAKGQWRMLSSVTGTDIDELARKEFAQNTADTKIEFYSDRELRFGDAVQLRYNGKAYDTQVSYVGIQSDDDRYYYKCGDMAVTLVELLAKELKK